MIAVIMEHQYEPGDWVAVACQGCPRLYLLNDEQYPACLMRIRFELPQTSAQVCVYSTPHLIEINQLNVVVVVTGQIRVDASF